MLNFNDLKTISYMCIIQKQEEEKKTCADNHV